ncbi:Best3 [Drosophila busckii]|uniref:Bestrophin homolog n=1 Tax=Drosophila busckii TaxID=30019 RepID=A0A0M3QWT7_DROBS|nr:bestrophin-4 [Drosophila busckii]ALC44679.1 Best3 [Drosophila busckii]
MTVSYTAEVATCRYFGCFWKLLGRWRASIYKIIWVDLLVFLFSFYAMAMLYRYALNETGRATFEDIVDYCRSYGALIPLSFVLGFYVAIIVDRWWSQYITVPWPDPLAVYVSALVRGQDEHGRLMRRTIMRYVCLSLTMVLTMISPGIKRRFPNYDYIVDVGMLTKNEASIIQALDEKFPKTPKYWMPIMWASSIMTRARKEGRIWDDFSLKSMIDELNKFRAGCNMLIHYDMISVPLVYTQVVTLAVYTYFLAAIFGHQYVERLDTTHKNTVSYYFPLFSTLEFFFFMGWLKVAETLICPFGDDDDDFELNWLIDRNLQVCYLIVDEMHNEHPELVKDQYWDDVFPQELPYADESQRQAPPEASTARLDLTKITSAAPLKRTTETSEVDFTNFGEDTERGHGDHELRIRFRSQRVVSTSSSISMVDLSTPGKRDEIDEGEEGEEGEEEEYMDLLSYRDKSMDDFDRLREERERERVERQMQHAAMTYDLIKGELANTAASDGPSTSSKQSKETSQQDTEMQTEKSYIGSKK